ncbi:MAG: M48 family metallopeptidase [Cystobacterineae bacterium]|nr:M48 family metallopeptidase [Cystobacterineae bacterium]
MHASSKLQRRLAKVFTYALLTLFLVPGLAFVFVQHAMGKMNVEILQSVARNIEKDNSLSPAEKQEVLLELKEAPLPSSACGAPPSQEGWTDTDVCKPYSELWQFHVMGQAAQWTLAGGLAVLLAILGLGAAAFVNRRMQYMSFVVGWRLLVATCVAAIFIQGAMLVWLSFWVSAFFLNQYWPQLIAVIGVAVGGGAIYVTSKIFRRVPESEVAGELLQPDDAPALWKRIEVLAKKVGTAPPEHMVAGIDTQFFVTQAPLVVGDNTLKGRILFVSIPLLRILDMTEADGVLAHELAHLRGGDSENSAALGPKLAHYDLYAQMMYESETTRPVYYVLALYRMIVEFAFQRERREREFIADRVAAQTVSAKAIGHSLIKIVAYDAYRTQIEQQLFEYKQKHGKHLGIAQFVAAGLHDYARSESFLTQIQENQAPHPYDSHPPLNERMQNVGCQVAETEYGEIVAQTPAHSWADEIVTAADIEQRLWQIYEQEFSEAHEQYLASRYRPDNAEEEAIVRKYFPPLNFELKGNRRIEVNHVGLVLPDDNPQIPWERVHQIHFEEKTLGGEHMLISHPEKKALGHAKTQVKLGKFKKPGGSEEFHQAVSRYWQRHQAMCAYQAKNADEDKTPTGEE